MSRYLTMQQFGRWGRAGNQFFQYAFLTGYAISHDLQLQIPPWIGNHLFGTYDLPVTKNLPVYFERGNGLQHPIPPDGDDLVDHDFRGYAQYHTSYFSLDKDRIRNVFRPVPSLEDRLQPAVHRLLDDGDFVVGIHLRRGDYGQKIFPIIPTDWYLRWMRNRYEGGSYSPKLFIATEDLSLVEDFKEYNPVTVETLGIDLEAEPMADCTYLEYDLKNQDSRAMDWYPDFYLLSKCHAILGPSSTFSFFAAMLALIGVEYWRASLEAGEFVRVDPWNDYPQLREHVRDYKHLPGIALQSNPYW